MNLHTLYVSDMDGTLMGSDSRVSARSAEIITSLTEDGAMITVATARTPATVVPLLTGIKTTPPAIVMTGAAMWDRQRGAYMNLNYIPETEVPRILEVCYRYGVTPFVYTLTAQSIIEVYHRAPEYSACERSFVEERSHLKLKHFNAHAASPVEAYGRVVLMFAMGTDSAIQKAAAVLQTTSGCSIFSYPDTFNPSINIMEIFAPGVSKAAAVSVLRRMVKAERVVVFGDSVNDLPMMDVADLSVAVENALPEVKEAADIIIGSNTSDAVARFIEKDYYSSL
ncbi:MAG: Cof-type HAD-IIB family hydrolase [Muribaculaceae bacterium]|nr:Cof-type HAD-IIB family hydrolase [Muribaculaceae bacterium]